METIKITSDKGVKSTLYLILTLLVICLSSTVFKLKAQSTEVQQLLLNVEKLSQLKNILSDMKRGYTIVANGYNAVKNISQGNFSMHEVFLDGLMLVNPEIRKYQRVVDIISYQQHLLSEYKSAYSRFRDADTFSSEELNYLSGIYGRLFDQSIDNLDELLTVITSSKLRMSDDERLRSIDRIFLDMQDKLIFLRSFNKEASILNLQRQKERLDINSTRKYFNQN